jgi:hypothetical protein
MKNPDPTQIQRLIENAYEKVRDLKRLSTQESDEYWELAEQLMELERERRGDAERPVEPDLPEPPPVTPERQQHPEWGQRNYFQPGLYRHYKGGLYVAFCIANAHDIGVPAIDLVIYFSLERQQFWGRPLYLAGEDSWTDRVRDKDGNWASRFHRLTHFPAAKAWEFALTAARLNGA